MNILTKIKILLYGCLARLLNAMIPVKKKHWVFASNYGMAFDEGPRNLILYILNNKTDINCTFITQNNNVYKYCKAHNIPCRKNLSIKGIKKIVQADMVFTSHAGSDILYAYPKKRRRFFYLMHGQPYKRGLGCLTVGYWKEIMPHSNLLHDISKVFTQHLVNSGFYEECSMVSATSEFTAKYMAQYFTRKTEVKILGSPRCDILFNKNFFINSPLKKYRDKIVVTYMPTHRNYGKGKIPPTLFINNKSMQNWLRENNMIILIKQHPQMLKSLNNVFTNDVIIDISHSNLDPFDILFHTDVLISDYSSVWIDFLLLQRPIIHYFYDDFINNDQGTLYNLNEVPSCHKAYSEDELELLLKQCKENYQKMCPPKEIVNYYHKYIDGNSCQRHYYEIMKYYN